MTVAASKQDAIILIRDTLLLYPARPETKKDRYPTKKINL